MGLNDYKRSKSKIVRVKIEGYDTLISLHGDPTESYLQNDESMNHF